MKNEPTPVDREVLTGVVERVTYQNAENGFCVLRIRARGHRELVTLVGHSATISAGEWVTATGNWVNDRTHGQQFKARFLKTSAPTSVEGIEKYLASGMIRGIGPVYAKKLLRAFGEKVFDIIEAAPDRLREVDGIGPIRAARITVAWAEQKAVREIMVFLHSHGVGTARAVRIYKTYGGDAVQVMSENPYRLARDIRGIGFKTADAIAMKLGIDKTAMVRVRAGISYALTEAMDEGHCGLPTDDPVPLAEKLLEVPQELIRTALDLELADGVVTADTVGDKRCVFLTGLYRAERGIAEWLLQLGTGKLPWPSIDPDKAIPWIEQRTGLVLAESQRSAVALALTSKVLVITGGPGVGKTRGHRLRGQTIHRAARSRSHRGGVGARSFNIELQAALNPAGERKVERFGWTFAPGDKVMQIENDYDKEVYNGDIGYIVDVDLDEGELTASFDGRSVIYGFGELDTLVPAYAVTIHKSQGSEYPAVIIPVLTQHYAMLQRNLLYTGITRGKRLVVLVGQKKAIAIAVRNVSGRRRWSKLREWLTVNIGVGRFATPTTSAPVSVCDSSRPGKSARLSLS